MGKVGTRKRGRCLVMLVSPYKRISLFQEVSLLELIKTSLRLYEKTGQKIFYSFAEEFIEDINEIRKENHRNPVHLLVDKPH